MAADAVLFDVDGTLIDSVDLHAKAWQEAFAHFGKRIGFEEVRSQIGKGGDQLLPVFFSQEELALRGEAIESYRSELYRRDYLKRIRAFPEVRELFQEISRRGIRIALASSAKGEDLRVYKEVAGVDDLLETETSADDASRSKPNPDIFQAALHRLGKVDARRSFVVGDTPWDVIAATRSGLKTLGMLCGGFAEADLRAAGAVEIYRDPADLLSRIDSSALA
ncbi:MAG TPA: HAD family hydrolase [Myxococcales bacterium]|jgi:HAD superfamily hydrolase (TIGR01549 family)|nr:HAD family hydrolase [Myxococcales bacterium]